MRKTILMISTVIIILGMVNKSLAGVVDSGTCNEKGTCLWSFDDSGKLTISGNGAMDDYTIDAANGNWNIAPRPWDGLNINIVSIEGVSKIGNKAFTELGASQVYIGDSVNYIGHSAFEGNNLTSLTVPDSVMYIDNYAFANNRDLSNLKMSDSISTIGVGAIWGTSVKSLVLPADSFGNFGTYAFDTGYYACEVADIICKGTEESCAGLASILEGYTCQKPNDAFFPHPLSIKSYSDEKNCDSRNYYWNGKSCNNKKNGINCAENWKQIEDWCNRIRYTPAEAAPLLHNDNTNEVTITFRK